MKLPLDACVSGTAVVDENAKNGGRDDVVF